MSGGELIASRGRYFTHDGWAVRVKGAERCLEWTARRTRAQARKVRDAIRANDPDFFRRLELVRVRIVLEVVPTENRS